MTEDKLSRREFMHIGWGVAGALAVSELTFAGLRFLSPRATAGEFGSTFNLGPFDQYPAGSVTSVEAGRFYLVRLPEGGFLAVYRRCTHLGCSITYSPAESQFVCPCHGSMFTAEGDVLNPPAPQPLDLFPLSINEAGEIVVDTSAPIERDRVIPEDIVTA